MAEITQPIQITPTATSGKYSFYPKTDGYYMLDPNGVETKIGGVQSTKIFGDNFQMAENEVQTSLSTITPTNYLTLTTPVLPIGKYRVGYNMTWKYDDVDGNAAHFHILDNGISHLPQDLATETKNIFDVFTVGSYYYIDALVAESHTLEINVHCDDISDTVTMIAAYLEIWRAS